MPIRLSKRYSASSASHGSLSCQRLTLRANDLDYRPTTAQQALLSNTTGDFNTATGVDALNKNTTGSANTATGSVLFLTTLPERQTQPTELMRFSCTDRGLSDGRRPKCACLQYAVSLNTAVGFDALLSNTTGNDNVAVGGRALQQYTTGVVNTAQAPGPRILYHCGHNSAIGLKPSRPLLTAMTTRLLGSVLSCPIRRHQQHGRAFSSAVSNHRQQLYSIGSGCRRYLPTGGANIDIGNAGVSGESSTIRIGNSGIPPQNRAFIAGVRGVTTENANALPERSTQRASWAR